MSIIAKNTTGSDITIAGVTISASGQYTIQSTELSLWATSDVLITKVGSGDIVINDGVKDLGASDGIDLVKGYQQKFTLENDRLLTVENRIPAGYTVYPTGISDAIQANGYGAGSKLKLDSSTTSVDFKILNHYYAIGGRAIWENANLNCYIDAKLMAPATVGINQAGDFDKYATGLGFNMYIPASPGAGAWDLDLDAVETGTNVLKCVPVPVAGNTGFFDYNSTTNVLTVNATQTGGYNLYDAELPLFAFARSIWGKKQDGAESALDIPNVIGKLLFNFWKVKFELKHDGGSLSTEKAGLIMVVATKGNV